MMNGDKSKTHLIWKGAALGIAPAALTFFTQFITRAPHPATIWALLASISIWPITAVALACRRDSHEFGLGMLLGVGVGWLVMAAICGGALH